MKYGIYRDMLYPIANFNPADITLRVNKGAVWVDYPGAIGTVEANLFKVEVEPENTQMADAVYDIIHKRILREERKLATILKKINTLKRYEEQIFVF